jgi:hypothetical protein
VQQIDSRRISAKSSWKNSARASKTTRQGRVGLPLAVIVNALEIYLALEHRAAFAELLT